MNLNYKSFTLGVEEEYMVLDPKTFELKSHEQKIVQYCQMNPEYLCGEIYQTL